MNSVLAKRSRRHGKSGGFGTYVLAAVFTVLFAIQVVAQDTSLSPRAKARDKNHNNLIERSEAGGPLKGNFEAMDCDQNGGLDGAEIRGYFTGAGCPGPGAQKAVKPRDPKALNPRAAAADANGNGVIDKDEAGGPLLGNFETIDTNNSGTLDGLEISTFFASRRGASARGAGGPAPTQPPRGKRKAPPVQIDKVVEQTVGQTFPVIGRLVARQSGVIATEVAGVVRDMRVNVGDRVSRGDVIAVLDADRAKSNRDRWAAIVEQRKATVETAKAQLKKTEQAVRRILDLRELSSAAFSRARYEDLVQDVAARKGTLGERRAQLSEARARLQRANIDLADAVVRAPFGGVVVEKHIDVGTYLRVGERIVSLINDSDIEVEAEVPTDQIGSLKRGVSVKVILDDGTIHSARVRAVVPQENLRTRTRTVRFTPVFKSLRKSLATDQSITVQVPLEGGTAITVHKDAIVRRGKNAVVYLVKAGRAFARQVELGRGVGVRFIVLKGLKPGDFVVVRGNERLGGGGPVKVVNIPPAANIANQ